MSGIDPKWIWLGVLAFQLCGVSAPAQDEGTGTANDYGELRGTYEFLEGADAAPLFAFYIEGETAKAIWEEMPQKARSDACNPSPYKRAGGLLCFAPAPGSDEPYLCQTGLNLATGATELVEGC